MSYQNDRYLLRLAAPGDSPAVRRVLESGGYPGKVAVQYTRRPEPLLSYAHDGDALVMVLVEEKASRRIVAVGGCVLRESFVNGGKTTIGYLTGMKALEEHRGGGIPIREAYQLIHEETRERCSDYITTILSGNTAAIRLLEKPHTGMPPYRYLGEYTVFCTGTGSCARVPRGLRFEQGADGLEEFYGEHLPRFQFAATGRRLHCLNDSDFYTLRSAGGEILAAGALWYQQDYKQYTITGYSPLLDVVRKLPIWLLGYPTLPLETEYADYLSIALPVVRPDAQRYAGAFLRLLAREAGRRHFVMLGLMEGHPLFPAARRLPHVKYQSRLYTVDYGGGTSFDGRPVMLEVGLL